MVGMVASGTCERGNSRYHERAVAVIQFDRCILCSIVLSGSGIKTPHLSISTKTSRRSILTCPYLSCHLVSYRSLERRLRVRPRGTYFRKSALHREVCRRLLLEIHVVHLKSRSLSRRLSMQYFCCSISGSNQYHGHACAF